MIARRSFLLGLGSLVAAPAVICTAGLLMPVRSWPPEMLRRQAILDVLPKPTWHRILPGRITYTSGVNEGFWPLFDTRRIAA